MFRRDLSVKKFALVMSLLNLVFFHLGFFRFVAESRDLLTLSGAALLLSLILAMLLANAFAFLLFLGLNRWVGRAVVILTFLISSVAAYFINTYHIIVDESMMGNVFNTNYAESSAYFGVSLLLHVFFLGILPSVYTLWVRLKPVSIRDFFKTEGVALLLLVGIAFANATNWLWVDKNSKTLGGLAMPWAYAVNAGLYFKHKADQNVVEKRLPDAVAVNQKKKIVLLIIGESARRENFSLYGYPRATNPRLSSLNNVHAYPATSAATYTTAGVEAILEPMQDGTLYETLPNYLYRNGAGVIWRTSNNGQPPLHIAHQQDIQALQKDCRRQDCQYDGALLSNLESEIRGLNKEKILVVLHTSTSHGPQYNARYPPSFEKFQPVCSSVELSKCTPQSLINAYDNTILYTDFLVAEAIAELQKFQDYESSVIFVSDHGESLGENNLYMHGLPKSLAPKQQYEIPFIVWHSNNSEKKTIPVRELTQDYVFHSVLDFLGFRTPFYRADLSVFQQK